jgi:hypothetical protein
MGRTDDALNRWIQRFTVALMVMTGVGLVALGAALYAPR